MSKKAASRRREPSEKKKAKPRAWRRPPWVGKLWLPLITVILGVLAFAPVSQFYLAWVMLAPWLLFVRELPRVRSTFWLSVATGYAMTALAMFWLMPVTVGGTLLLVFYMSLYWGFAALFVRALGLLDERRWTGWWSIAAVLLFATLWTGLDFFRGNFASGIAWLYVGHTQTPLLPAIQIADIFGVYGVTFVVVALNMAVALAIVHRDRLMGVAPAIATALIFFGGSIGYGFYRIGQDVTTDGPTITVIQSNYPQDASGEKSEKQEVIVDFHVSETERALREQHARGVKPDLVVWSETMMPALNPAARELFQRTEYGQIIELAHARIAELARQFDVSILTGAIYFGEYDLNRDRIDRRNSAYFFYPTGQLAEQRYDKIYLVPFGEYIPFKQSIPFLHKLLFKIVSPYDFDYTVQAGAPEAMTVFELSSRTRAKPVRFVTPICYEDVNSRLVARMFRGDDRRGKRADMIVNITNDGWFAWPELPQHLQIAIFRSVENRVPSARSVNTGISGFVDSVGRAHDILPIHETGASTAMVRLDPRLTLYTRFGDVFAITCTGITAVFGAGLILRAARSRRGS